MNPYTDRLVRAMKLQPLLFEEVERDATAMRQAILTVMLASLAVGLTNFTTHGFSGLIFGALSSLFGWVIWAALIWYIGTKLFPEPTTSADVGELLRTTGFAYAPGLLQVFGVVPAIGGLLFWIASVWMLLAMVLAVRQALDYDSTLRAIGVCLAGWVVQSVLIVLSRMLIPVF